jgi:hypothetical protein
VSRQVVVIMGRHRPHEQLLLGLSTISGATYLLGAPPPTSVAAAMPMLGVKLWAGGLLISGVAGLVGSWRHGERGMLLEQGGLLIGAAALVMYAVMAAAYAGWNASFAVGFGGAWAAANLWRARQSWGDLRELRRAR